MDPDLAPGYGLSFDWIRRLAMLEWLATESAAMTGGQLADLASLVEEADDDQAAAETLEQDLQFMEHQGWVQFYKVMGGLQHWSFDLTPPGRTFLAEIQQRRGDVVARRKAARDAVLRWLYDQKAKSHTIPTLSDIFDSVYSYYYGQPFSAAEVDEAGGWLYERGYVRGTRPGGHAAPLRPVLASKGEDLVEAGKSVNDFIIASPAQDAPLAVPGTLVHVTGSSNVTIVAGSPGATQNVTINEDNRKQILSVADSLEQILPMLQGLDEAQTQELREAAADLRTGVAQEHPEVGWLRDKLTKAKLLLGGAAATGLTEAVSGHVQTAIESLPGL